MSAHQNKIAEQAAHFTINKALKNSLWKINSLDIYMGVRIKRWNFKMLGKV